MSNTEMKNKICILLMAGSFIIQEVCSWRQGTTIDCNDKSKGKIWPQLKGKWLTYLNFFWIGTGRVQIL